MNKKSKTIWIISLLVTCAIGYILGSIMQLDTRIVQKDNKSLDSTSTNILNPKNSTAQKVGKLKHEIQSLKKENQAIGEQLAQIKQKQPRKTDVVEQRKKNWIQSTIDYWRSSPFIYLQNATTLTDEQLFSIENFLNDQGDQLEKYSKSIDVKTKFHKFSQKRNELLGSDTIKGFLAGILSNQQIEDYEKYSIRRSEAKLEAEAYRELSNVLATTTLTKEQQNQIFEFNYKKSLSASRDE